MCGLIGAFRADKALFPVQVKGFIAQGLYVSALRGMGGTGVGLVDKDFDIDMVKTHIDAGNFVFTDKFNWVEKNADTSRVILGHTRAPTGTATISSKNSHPFWYGDGPKKDSVIGIHNGHINNHYSLTPQGFTHPVDSAHAIYSIYLNGAIETLKKIMGYYVLIWYNQKDRTLNMARNTHRELYLARNKAKTVLYYASEESILQFALDRNGIEYDPDYGFAELDPHTLYSWDLNEPTIEKAYITKYEEKKETGYTPGTGKNGNSGPYSDYWRNSSSSPLMKEGTQFFTFVKDPDTAWVQYSSGSDGWGRVHGVRKMDNGLVTIEGVNKKDWETKWIYLSDALPCDCTRSEFNFQKINNIETKTPVYSATLDKKACERDYRNWLAGHTQLKELEKKDGYPNANERHFDDSNKDTSSSTAIIVLCEGPEKRMIPQDEWLKMAKEGCVVCHGSIGLIDLGKVLFYPWQRNPEDTPEDTEYQMVCPICTRNPEDVQRALGYIPL